MTVFEYLQVITTAFEYLQMITTAFEYLQVITNSFEYLQVITTVFEYLTMLRKAGPQEWFYKELQVTEETCFRWKEQVVSHLL